MAGTKTKTALEETFTQSGYRVIYVMKNSGISYMRFYALRNGATPDVHEANALAKVFDKTTEELFPKEKA